MLARQMLSANSHIHWIASVLAMWQQHSSGVSREDKTRKLMALKAAQSCAQPKNVRIYEQILILFYMWAEPSVTAA